MRDKASKTILHTSWMSMALEARRWYDHWNEMAGVRQQDKEDGGELIFDFAAEVASSYLYISKVCLEKAQEEATDDRVD